MNLAAGTLNRSVTTGLAERLDPAHTALLVIDMQNDFCAPGGYIESVVGKDASACRSVVGPIEALVAAARATAIPVIWVRANYALDKLPAAMATRFAEQGKGRVCCAPGSWGAEFYVCKPGAGETILEKNCFSAFIGTDLETRLHAAGKRTVVFAGVQTNICVESTLRDALSLGFNVVIAENCVASHTADLHAATLKNVRLVLGDVLDGAEIASIWRRALPDSARTGV
jgi:ureidoacrylate peracid hydrolase